MPACRIRLFGPPAVTVGGEARTGLRSKSIALLAYLAVEDRPVGRDTLATLFWPESGQKTARQNLRTSLHDIGRILPRGAVVTTGDTVRLDPDVVATDAGEFRRLCAEGGGEEELLRCCPGEFMEGFTLRACRDFDNWQLGTAESFRRQLATRLEKLIEGRLARGRPESAVDLCRRLVALDTLEESSHRLAMRVYAACGRWAAAEKQYRACRDTLREELGVGPDRETVHLAEAVARRDLALGPVRGTCWPTLPQEVDGFFGRAAEIDRIEKLLAEGGARLLTLTGPAGTGKTRLAIRMAHRLSARYPDGIAFVDLTRTASAQEVVPLIGGAIGFREQGAGGQAPAEILARHLGGRRMLLILDNFEHVLAAARQVGALLARAATLQVVCTSREPLRLAGEATLHVPPLELPATSDLAEVSASPAVRLLLDRARLADPAFRMDAGNCEALARLCAELDGLPLALELAVPLLRLHHPRDLADRLKRPLDYLRSGGDDRPERHRSLARAIDWSYDPLSPDEKRLFASLSVLANGFDLPAVEEVCGAGTGAGAVLESFRALVEKSLVRRRDTPLGPRFDLLESTREYSAQKAAGLPGLETLRARQAEHYRRFASKAETGMRGRAQVRWMQALGLAQGNLAAALDWYERTRRWEAGLEMADALTWFWYRSGQFGFGRRWLAAFLEGSGGVPSALRARALHSLGWLTFLLGEWRAAHALYAESLYTSRQAADPVAECRALADLGVAERWLGNRTTGWQYALSAVEVGRTLEEPAHLARALIWAYATTGGAYIGDPPVVQLKEVAALARRTGDEWLLAHAFNGLGDLYCALGQPDHARRAYETSLAGFERLGDRFLAAWNLEGLGRVELLSGNRVAALRRTAEALVLFDGLGDELNVALMLARIVGLVQDDRDEPAAARVAGAAAVLLERFGERRLMGAPQIAEALRAITCLEAKDPVGWLQGQGLTRAAAVEAALEIAAR